MNLLIFIPIGFFLLLIICVWIALRFLKNKRKKSIIERKIPEEILKEFNHAEKEMKGGIDKNGNTNPYSILWKIAKDREFRESNKGINLSERDINGTKPQSSNRELHTEPIRRKSIQDRASKINNGNTEINRKPNRNNFRTIVSGFRRKRS